MFWTYEPYNIQPQETQTIKTNEVSILQGGVGENG
jgi:hypothetical protein